MNSIHAYRSISQLKLILSWQAIMDLAETKSILLLITISNIDWAEMRKKK
jgi:hypothetical protein